MQVALIGNNVPRPPLTYTQEKMIKKVTFAAIIAAILVVFSFTAMGHERKVMVSSFVASPGGMEKKVQSGGRNSDKENGSLQAGDGRNSTKSGEWTCCVKTEEVNDLHNHPDPDQVQDIGHNYECPENPSNFSWYYASSKNSKPKALNREQWKKKSLLFVGGSTTRQMAEQYRWEMPSASKQSKFVFAQFLFHHIEGTFVNVSIYFSG